ncbi:MAG TPA: DHA2 family efflux MFS transporter permease subunit [Dehalococcoidia bacterium]|nr:DHA2 family efflux MFS transporter permease subunit [Dehalococcoidia bacterium]
MTTQAVPSEANLGRAWTVLAITAIATFAVSLDTTIMFIAFPEIGESFASVTRSELSWVINAYIIVFAALLVPSGRLADRIGRRGVFLAGLALFTVASAFCGIAPSAEALIGARIVQAIGGALLFPASLALILREFPHSKRATAVAAWAAVGALAAALGPSVGGVIIDQLGWRWAFYINIPICTAALIIAARVLTESYGDRDEPTPDLTAVPLLIGAVGALALGIVQGEDWGWTDGRTLAAFAVSAVLTPLFLFRSARHPSPALDLTLFREHNFRMANVATLSFGIAFAAMFIGLVLFLTLAWRYSTLEAGFLIWPGPLTAAITAAPAGRLADRIGHRRIIFAGGVIYAIGAAVLYSQITLEREIATVWIPAAILTGAGVGLTMPSLASAAVHSLAPQRFAVGSAVNQTVRQIGAVIGVALVIALIGDAPTDIISAFERVFLMMIAGGLVTAALALTIDTRPRSVVVEAPLSESVPVKPVA